MRYMAAVSTDAGIVKSTNQDSSLLIEMETSIGRAIAAVVCDGMGGFSKGELASAAVIRSFRDWFISVFPYLCEEGLTDNRIREEWDLLVKKSNELIRRYGRSQNIMLGTTLTAVLLTETKYYIINVGDTRAYKISDEVARLTYDHSVVAREVSMGNLTEEEAEHDPRRNQLLQCIGACDPLIADIFIGEAEKNVVYMLCSDGFRHEISNDEMMTYLSPSVLESEEIMKNNLDHLINVNKERNEQDNITVAAIKTY